MTGTASAVAGVLAGVMLVSASFVRAAEPSPIVGPPVVVTATRIDEPAARSLIGARVITARDIERSAAPTLSALLRSLPEVRTRELPGSPNPQIDMRGFGLFGDHNTLVLLDGVRMREYEQLTVNWSAIPLSSIERIEILPASSAVLYGGGATGGTVNIVTKAAASGSRQADLGAEVATYDTLTLHASGSVAGRNVSLRMYGSHYETDNYRDNNRVRIDNVQAAGRWTGQTGLLDIKVGADDQRLGLPGVISEAQMALNRRQAGRPLDFATQGGAYFHLGSQGRVGSGDLAMKFSYSERDTASSFLVGTPLRNTVDTQVEVWTFAPRMRFKPDLGGWDNDLVVGADAEEWNFDGNSGPVIVSRPHSTQRSAALYAQHTMTFATQTTLALGAREQHARYGVTDLANPAATGARKHTLHAWDVSARQALAPALSAYARVGSSFRLPNVNDNFNPTFARVTLLEPQTAREWEVGLEGSFGAGRYRAAAFRADLDNEIFFDPVTLGSRNRQPTRRDGLSLEGSWQAAPFLELHANYIYADATFRAGTAGSIPIAGKRVPISPRDTLLAGATWTFSANARADFDVRYTGSSVFDADEANTFGREIPGYTVADVRFVLRSSGWLVNAGVRNLFDEKYYSYGVVTGRPTFSAFPAAERTLFISAQHTFQ